MYHSSLRDLQPLPPAGHLTHTNQETGEQIPQPVEEAGQHICQTEVGSDVHPHDSIEHHQVECAVNDEQVPACNTTHVVDMSDTKALAGLCLFAHVCTGLVSKLRRICSSQIAAVLNMSRDIEA